LPHEGDVRRFGGSRRWHLDADALYRDDLAVLPLADLPLPGRHNALNLCGALAAIEAAGFDAAALATHARSFRPLPHRLQTLGERDGVTYVDDSIATTPQAALAAIRHFAGRPVAVLLGGHERGLDWQGFAREVAALPEVAAVTMGANGERIAQALAAAGLGERLQRRDRLDDAFATARATLRTGGVLLLAPGAPSFGEFRDYVARGRRFAELAGFDPDHISDIEGLGIA
jgi:UDP-N-acetylmuramoyl-L-alanine---L-glutamate ligase